ncbi:MAG TPA: SpoIIE family protein phosphatase [Spirochaetota bacterium]|nr:SpoIIE family protein phosphatase [Spirochaetota bacterium]HPC43183.1 SpoIIE family protein phosphatase [Spirochaetota bacterium]HPL15480.1 SpoIIE family protein phosphatase [Spirochaetota bacterium]HQF10494.1 SpoIIE family protein phosphatase [Spirochaetota bacterium]HQH99468.1 SpoIIE family protein phosphatase [Spirochaetota bacterium]
MKLSLRMKLFLGFMTLNLTVSLLFGFFMYKASSDRFFSTFREHKLSIARFISTAIDGDVHESFTTKESAQGPKFWRYIKIMNTTWKNEKEVRYIYTLNYDRKQNKLFYALDANIPEQDIMWFETPSFAFDYFFDKDGRMTVEYNYTFYKEDFDINTDIGKVRISLRNGKDKKQLLVQGQPVFEVLTIDPLSAKCPGGISKRDDRVKTGSITVNGTKMECTITYSGKGEPSSYPGNDFVEMKKVIDQMIGIIKSKKDYVDKEIVRNAYGSFITAYSPIVNSKGEGIGIVCVDINSREVIDFRRSILLVAIAMAAITFVISTLFTIYLSQHFTQPLAKLMTGINTLASGDMTTMVDIRSGDEFSRLAESFNSMVRSLHNSSEEQKRLINEISQLNENLEQRVIDRTLTIQAQSEELNRQIMMARRIQMSLLPVRLPDINAVTLSFKYQPMMAVGGDFIDFYYNNREMMLFICDVSGHGVPAAFLSAMVKMSLPACYNAGRNTSLAMEKLHQSLQGKMGGHFISAIFCHIDLAAGTMTSTNAGHPPIIIIRKAGDVEFVGSQGRIISEKLPLNAMNVTTKLNEGDKMILYTDGITEARNHDLVMFGEDNLVRFVRQHRMRPATELCEEIYRMVINYIGTTSPEFEDDITLMVSEYNG